MILFALGFIAGIAMSIFLAGFILRRKEIVEHWIKNQETKQSKQIAEFFAPTEMEAEAVADIIKENEKKGRDTELEEM